MKPKYQILVDNNPAGKNFACEHGYSVFIEYAGVKILLDTGRGGMFISNAKLCGIDPASADIVVLSHGHYDHGDGLPFLEKLPADVPVYMHSNALGSHFSLRSDGKAYDISLSADARKFLNDRTGQVRMIDVPTEISSGIWLTGSIARQNDFEDVGGKFYVDESCESPDEIIDDMSLWIDSPDGLCIFTGCCHSGIINTLECIFAKAAHRRVCSITGGLHLLNADENRLSKTKQYLQSLGNIELNLLHCTGEAAAEYLLG